MVAMMQFLVLLWLALSAMLLAAGLLTRRPARRAASGISPAQTRR